MVLSLLSSCKRQAIEHVWRQSPICIGAGYLGCPKGPFGANARFWNLISAIFLPVALVGNLRLG